MHCFAFTAVETATDADWKAWHDATDKLPKEIPGLLHVWHGKLAAPLGLPQIALPTGQQPDPEKLKAYRAGTPTEFPVKRIARQYGACFQFKDKAAFDAYSKAPAHDAWTKLYEKVRVDGTTTYQILGQ